MHNKTQHAKTFIVPKLIAHRGARGYAPENTCIAMKKAQELGAKWVEFDVMLTKDGEAIIMHDETLDRTTNGHGDVAQTTYATVAKLDAGSWYHEKFRGEAIPRFVDMIHCLAESGLGANIEIKPTAGQEAETARVVLQILQEHWPANLPQPLLSSFNLESLRAARALAPQAAIGLLFEEWPDNWQKLAKELKPFSIHLDHEILDANKVSAIKQQGYQVFAYTVNDAERARELFAMGVDGIFTDYFDRVQN